MYFVYFIFILSLVASGVRSQLDYSCPLVWVPEGFGNVPKYSISPSPGEYVARVNLLEDTEWRVGRLIPDEGNAQVPFLVLNGQHSVLESETYEVLTNPGNCVIDWEPAFGGVLPTYAISGDETETVEFVSRAEVAGFVMTGAFRPEESAAFVPYEGRVYPRRHYEVLTSVFPQMTFKISEFSYPALDFRVLDSKSKDVLVGQMELLNDFSSPGGAGLGGGSAVYPIYHSKDIKEVFRFQEKFGWHGVSNVSIDMDLWVGSPSVEAYFTDLVDTDPYPTLEFKRTRQVNVDRTVTVSQGSAFSAGESSQVCSSIRVIKDFGVRWQAVAEASMEGMRGDQVKTLLLRSGRNIIEVDDWSDVVRVRLQGTLRGTFAIGSMATHSQRDSNGACTSVLANNGRKRAHHNH